MNDDFELINYSELLIENNEIDVVVSFSSESHKSYPIFIPLQADMKMKRHIICAITNHHILARKKH